MRQTPLFAQHIKLGASMINLKGVARPVEYHGHAVEHHATRNTVTLCDVSHMGELTFTGKDAAKLLQRVLVGNVEKLVAGKAMYSAYCNESGHVQDDLVLMHLSEDRYLMVVNVTKIEKDYQWFMHHAHGLDVEVSDVSTATALMALQGPHSRETLQKITRAQLDSLQYYEVVETEIATVAGGVIPCVISRTGYTGERGFEICVTRDGAPFIWEELMRAGRPLGIMGHGVAARESLRTEAGLLLNGNDLDGKTTPYEGGIGWIVDLSTDFIGREALVAAKAAGPSKKLVGLSLDGQATMRHGYTVFSDAAGSHAAGTVTSGPLGRSLTGNSCAFAYVQPEFASPGQHLFVSILGDLFPVEVVTIPFRPRRAKDNPQIITRSPFSLFYLNPHLWIAPAPGGTANTYVVGLTEYAQDLLGEVLYFKAPTPGQTFTPQQPLAYTDSYRCVFPIALPVSGTVVAVNTSIVETPYNINRYPYHENGLFIINSEMDISLFNTYDKHTQEVFHMTSYAEWTSMARTV